MTISGLTAALLVLLTSLICQQPALAQANVQGQWQTLPTSMPINPIHVALMHTGKVLVVSGSGNVATNTNYQAGVWDPASDTVTTQPVGWDMFCNGMVVFPDGRPFVVGGTLAYDPFHGSPKTSAYDPLSGQFADLQTMAHGRWYPTATTLGDGSVLVFSGLNENGPTNNAVEIYTVGSGWSQEYPSWVPPLYPRLHLLPTGNVFYSGPTNPSMLFDTGTKTWSQMASTNYSGGRLYGSSVLLPLTPANGYTPRVMIFGGGNPATATTEIIDLSAASPTWRLGPPMSQPRIEMNAVILPNGKVLALGGSTNDEDATTASLNADLFDANGATVSSAGQNAFPRLYHSVALLLPDATVWVAGGNPTRGNYEPHMEIYSPAYLFAPDGSLAPRPQITGVTPGVIAYGNTFQVQTPDAASISSVVLVRPGAPTHAFDMDQRLVGMTFTAGNGVLSVTAPPNGNIAPPGYYLLFVLNSAGVPSVASFVQLSSSVQPDFSISASPASQATSPGASTSYTVNVTPGTGFTGTVTLDAGGLPPGATATFSPATITASGSSTLLVSTSTATPAGSYPLTITGTSGAAAHSTTVSLTINSLANPVPSLSTISPTSVPEGGAGFTLTLAGGNFVANSAVQVNGSSRATTFVSSTQLTASIPASDVAVAASLSITVFNPSPGGGTSAALTLTVNNPLPSISSISPNPAVGISTFTLTVNGSGFVNGSVVQLDGSPRPTTFVSATQLQAQISAMGQHTITVFNSAPGGGTSNSVSLTVITVLGQMVVPNPELLSRTLDARPEPLFSGLP